MLARVAAEIGARFVFTSTDMVFDGRAAPYDERAAPSPLSAYARSKRDGERETLRWPGALVLRLPLLYGVPASKRETTFLSQVRGASRRAPAHPLRRRMAHPLVARGRRECSPSQRGEATARGCCTPVDRSASRASRWENAWPTLSAMGATHLSRASRLDVPSPEPRPADLSFDSRLYHETFGEPPGRTMDCGARAHGRRGGLSLGCPSADARLAECGRCTLREAHDHAILLRRVRRGRSHPRTAPSSYATEACGWLRSPIRTVVLTRKAAREFGLKSPTASCTPGTSVTSVCSPSSRKSPPYLRFAATSMRRCATFRRRSSSTSRTRTPPSTAPPNYRPPIRILLVHIALFGTKAARRRSCPRASCGSVARHLRTLPRSFHRQRQGARGVQPRLDRTAAVSAANRVRSHGCRLPGSPDAPRRLRDRADVATLSSELARGGAPW